MKFTRTLLLLLLCSGILLEQVDRALLNPPVVLAAATPQKPPAHATQPATTNQFRRIEKPLGLKIAVTLGGLALIGLELWWFLCGHQKID